MASQSGPPDVVSGTTQDGHVRSPPPDGAPNMECSSKFTELRKCYGQLTKKVASLDMLSGPLSTPPTMRPIRSPDADSQLTQKVSELESEMRRQSDGQEGLKQGQIGLMEKVTELRDTLLTSSQDPCGDNSSLHQSVTSSTSGVYRMYSRTNSCGSFPAVFTPTSDMSEMSSANSFYAMSSGIEKQRDELEACLSKEMMKNLESRIAGIELQEHQLSEDLLSLKERVQKLWQADNQYRRTSLRVSNSNLSIQPLPPHIRAFCMNIEDVIHVRISDFARYLGISDEFDAKGGYSYRAAFWAVIKQWSKKCFESGSNLLLEHLLDACQKCGIQNPLEVEPMPLSDRRVLEQNYSFLAGHVMVPMVLTYLRDTGMLTSDLVRYVLEPDPKPEKVTRLVDVMTVFGKHALQLLKDSLRRSGQGHIADNLMCREEALDPDVPVSALPSVAVRLKESLKCQLREIHTQTDQVRRQQEVCHLPTGKLWSGLFLNMDVSVNIPSHSVSSLRLLMEANQLRSLKHRYILKLIGVSLQTDPPWIITESVMGNLLTHLRSLQEESVSFSTVLNMASQICNGMLYMESKGCIHGDLRAENILMTDNKTLKLANFHIRTPEDKADFMSNCSRWSAPETMKLGVTSIKSDVWSFGVVLWEVVTLGLVPYPDMDMSEMTDKVDSGYTMPRPHTKFPQTDYMHDVMTQCWKYFATERPSFAHLNSLLTSTRPKSTHSRDTVVGHSKGSSVRSEAFERASSRSSVGDSRRSSLRRRKSLPRDRSRRDHVTDVSVYVEDAGAQHELKKKKKSLLRRLLTRKKE